MGGRGPGLANSNPSPSLCANTAFVTPPLTHTVPQQTGVQLCSYKCQQKISALCTNTCWTKQKVPAKDLKKYCAQGLIAFWTYFKIQPHS